MTSVLNRYATPLITGLFLVSLISGVALFFHLGSAWFHGMHEWLSMILIVPFALHIWKNWRAMSTYFRKPAFAIAMVASVIAAAAFIVPAASSTGQGGRPPQFAFANTMMQGSVAETAAMLDTDADTLVQALTAQGFAVADAQQSLSEIAAATGQPEAALMAALTR